jgi:glutathione S-transferase
MQATANKVKIRVTAFQNVPPPVQGLVRDLRVRWALEEAGIPYEQKLIKQDDLADPAYRRLQPFGQVPVIEMDGLELFESGSIVLEIAERSEALMPKDAKGRARARTWVIAALNSVEQHFTALVGIDLFSGNEEWAKLRRPAALEMAHTRLKDLSAWLGEKEYLEGSFTAGDLIMVTVLRFLRHSNLVAEYPNLDAYLKRCEARPAFQRALAAQMKAFEA